MKNRLSAFVAIITLTFGLAPSSWAGQVPSARIQGEVNEKCGQELPPGLRAQLVDVQGTAVPAMTTPVGRDAGFVFSNVAPGLYTVRIIGLDTPNTVGMTAVAVTAGRSSSARVTVGEALCGGRNTTTKMLIAAVLRGGGVPGVIATRDQAGPSR